MPPVIIFAYIILFRRFATSQFRVLAAFCRRVLGWWQQGEKMWNITCSCGFTYAMPALS